MKKPALFMFLLLVYGLGLFAQDRGITIVANENLGSSASSTPCSSPLTPTAHGQL
jgi:hypothetical protein